MTVQVVLVHGIRTSATMWRAQREYLSERGNPATAVDLPGHGARMKETFTLDTAFTTIDDAVYAAAALGPVLLVGHSMGGLLSAAYLGRLHRPPVHGFVAASCTALPHGAGLAAYRLIARGVDALPGRGVWLGEQVIERTLPVETRPDFGAGGYALDTQDIALASLAALDLVTAIRRIEIPIWFINGQFDQLRINERMFLREAHHAELIVVPQTTHLVTAMRPRVFNALLNLALTTLEQSSAT
jgi:non-heme chloroperoxidase